MFKGLGALGDMGKLMQQAKEMQAKAAEVQERLATIEVSGEAGAGLVKVVCTAKGEVRSIDLDDTLVVVSEKGVLEDLIVAAVNDARARGQERAQEEMKELTAGLPMPPGFGG